MLSYFNKCATLRRMSAPLKAPDWFLDHFGLIDGVFDEERTVVVGRMPASVGTPLLAQGLVDTPFPKASVELEKVLPAIKKRLADEGYIATGRLTYEPRLRLILEPAPDEALKSPAFQSDLASFRKDLNDAGIEFSSRHATRDAAASAGWSLGEITILLSTLGPTALVQLRKLLEAVIKARAGRKLKLRCGPLTVDGNAEEVGKIITHESLKKFFGDPPENTTPHKTSKKPTHE
jgi:hypothetical protein